MEGFLGTQIINLSLIISSLLSVAVGLRLIFDKKKRPNQLILAFILFMTAIWAWSLYGAMAWRSEFASSISFSVMALFMIGLVSFVLSFSKKPVQTRFFVVLALPAVSMSLISLYPDAIIADFSVSNGHLIKNAVGPFFVPYQIFIFGYFGILIYLFSKIFPSTRGTDRIELKYVAVGVGIGSAFALTSNFILSSFGIQNLNTLGPVFMLFMVAGVAYGLSKHRLLGSRVILAELLSITLMLVVFVWLVANYSIFNLVLFACVILISILFIRTSIVEGRERIEIERKQKQLELDKVELQSLDKLKDEFIKMATHEISSPLCVINSKLSMIFDEKVHKLNREDENFLRPVYYSAKRMSDLFSKVLQVLSVESSSFILLRQEGSLLEIARQTVLDNMKFAELKGIEIKSILTTNKFPLAKIDEAKIRDAMDAFLKNAIMYSESGGTVRVRLALENNKAVFCVEDNGIGIPDSNKKYVFEKFFQSERFDESKPTEQQGCGLSLYLSKKIIEFHGGKVWFESEVNRGSKFYFSLPLSA